MAKQGKSSVARRREQIRRRKEQQNRTIRIVAGGAIVLLALVAGYFVWQSLRSDTEASAGGNAGTLLDGERPLAAMDPAERNNYYSATPDMVIDTEKEYEAVIRTENGEMRLRLFDDEAPQTVNNFVFLASQGFYDGTTFHRVIENFMAQAGDPTGTGSGGPGYQFADETDNGLTFDRPGLLAMANAGPNTNGSQFFITFVPTPHLNGAHTIFGEVVEGDEVLSQITRRQPGAATPGDVIERIDVYEVE